MAETIEPPVKKAKKVDNNDEFIENIINSDTNLVPILSDLYYDSIPMVTYHAGCVKDTKMLSTAVRVLNEKLLLPNQHLKRVNKKCILLCPTNYLSKISCQSIQKLIELQVPELKDAFDYIKDVKVPSIPPVTKKQYTECMKNWTCNFHPNKYIEKMLSGSCFSQPELRSHRTYMGLAFEVAKICLTRNNFTPTTQDLLSNGINAAVVVDQITNSVVTVAFDNRIEHPIQHAAMIAIDNVAKTQNGGVWNENTELSKEIINKVKGKFPNIVFGARGYVSKKDAAVNESVDDSPYLCTGYDIYLIREPCMMCAMGLVHARIKKVFYTYDNEVHGALRSKTKLHCNQSLNHRFEVFTGFVN